MTLPAASPRLTYFKVAIHTNNTKCKDIEQELAKFSMYKLKESKSKFTAEYLCILKNFIYFHPEIYFVVFIIA